MKAVSSTDHDKGMMMLMIIMIQGGMVSLHSKNQFIYYILSDIIDGQLYWVMLWRNRSKMFIPMTEKQVRLMDR